jgi:hypothetical protein
MSTGRRTRIPIKEINHKLSTRNRGAGQGTPSLA